MKTTTFTVLSLGKKYSVPDPKRPGKWKTMREPSIPVDLVTRHRDERTPELPQGVLCIECRQLWPTAKLDGAYLCDDCYVKAEQQGKDISDGDLTSTAEDIFG